MDISCTQRLDVCNVGLPNISPVTSAVIFYRSLLI